MHSAPATIDLRERWDAAVDATIAGLFLLQLLAWSPWLLCQPCASFRCAICHHLSSGPFFCPCPCFWCLGLHPHSCLPTQPMLCLIQRCFFSLLLCHLFRTSPHQTPRLLPTLFHLLKMFSASTSSPSGMFLGAKDAWAGLFSVATHSIFMDILDDVVWKRFFMLPRYMLGRPPRGGQSH